VKKLIYILLGALFIPIFILVIFVIIPLFLLFLILLKMFTFRIRRKSPRQSPPSSRKIHQTDDVVDIECEVMDDK
jgi:hypothetical protein